MRESLARRVAGPTLVFVVTCVCFWPATRNGFVNWDDDSNYLRNNAYRAWSWETVRWAFSTRHMGHYQPLNWLSFMVDDNLSRWLGLTVDPAAASPWPPSVAAAAPFGNAPNPTQFHRTQVLLHALTATLVFFLARRLFRRTQWSHAGGAFVDFAAVGAALLFGLHPLRVESVAWASARTDVWVGLFLAAAVLDYLRAAERGPDEPGRLAVRWRIAACFALALLSKLMAVTFPLVLLVLDLYPLHRAPSPTAFLRRSHRRLILQKAELFALALVAVWIGRWAQADAAASLTVFSTESRLAVVPVGLAAYPRMTLCPIQLSPLYEFPGGFGFGHPLVWKSAAACGAAALAVWMLRRRCPAIGCGAVIYAIVLLPVLGIAQRGTQMVADRYSYLACIPLALLAGAPLILIRRRATRAAAMSAMVVGLGVLACMTREQIAVWHDSHALWSRAIAQDPFNATAHQGLAETVAGVGRIEEAVGLLERAVAIRPTQIGAWRRLGELQYDLGRDDAAISAFEQALQVSPDDVRARVRLARTLAEHHRFAEAEPHLRRLAEDGRFNDDTLVRHMLADACAARGAFAEAVRWLDEALAIARRRGEPAVIEALTVLRARYAAAPALPRASQPSDVRNNRPDSPAADQGVP